MDDLKVWEEIPAPKTIGEKIAEINDVLKHLEEKMPKGCISRESECYGCWLDVKEELETLQLMGDKDYLEFNYGTDEEPKIGRMMKSQSLERIDYKLDLYYETTDMEEALKMEYETPSSKEQNKQKGLGGEAR